MSSAKEDKNTTKPKGNFHNKFKPSSNKSSSSFKTSNSNSYKGIHLLDFNGDLAKWKLELKSLVELELPLLKKMFNDQPKDVVEGDLVVNCNTMYMVPGVERSIRNLSDLDSVSRDQWIKMKNLFLDFLDNNSKPSDSSLPPGITGNVRSKERYRVQFKINGVDYPFDNRLLELQDTEIEAHVSRKVTQTSEIQLQRAQLQGHILKSLKQDLKDKVLIDSSFINDIKERHDPLKLIKLISKISSNTLHVDIDKQKHDVWKAYYSLRQYNLSLVAYYNQTNQLLERMRNILDDKDIPNGETLAVNFADGLERTLQNGHFLNNNKEKIKNHEFKSVREVYEAIEKHYKESEYCFSRNQKSSDQIFKTQAAYYGGGGGDDSANGKKSSKKKKEKKKRKRDENSGESDKGDNDDKRLAKRNPVTCFNCGKVGHVVKDCRFEKDQARINVAYQNRLQNIIAAKNMNENALVVSDVNQSSDVYFQILLDSQATSHLFKNSELLTDIQECLSPITFNGIGGQLKPLVYGKFLEFNHVYQHDQCPANLLSLYRVCQTHDVDWDMRTGFTIFFHDGATLPFPPDPSGHFIGRIRMSDVLAQRERRRSQNMFLTVGELEERYNPTQIKRAREAKDLMRKMSYPSASVLCKLLRSGGVQNCDLTPEDVARSIKIYGPDLASLKGKTTGHPPGKVPPIIIQNLAQQDITLYGDIMFLDHDPYFITVSRPLNLTLINHMGGKRSASVMKKCFDSQYQLYRQRNFVVKHLYFDGEGPKEGHANVFGELLAQLNVKVEIVVGAHIPIVEQRIRRIKERVRSHLSVLPFRVTKKSMMWLVIFVVHRYNLLPLGDVSDMMSPRQRFTGLKPDLKKDLRLGFGDYVQAHVPIQESEKNSMRERTEGAIALYPAGNYGAWKFLLLKSGSLVTRYHWTVLPMPSEVVQRFEELTKVSYTDGYHERVLEELPKFNQLLADDEEDGENFPHEIVLPRVEPNLDMDIEVETDPNPQVYERVVQSRQPSSRVRTVSKLLSDPDFEVDYNFDVVEDNSVDEDYVDPTDVDHTLVDESNPQEEESSDVFYTDFVCQDEALLCEADENLKLFLLQLDPRNEVVYRMYIKEAIDKWKDKAVSAIREELNQMIDKEVWKVLPRREIPRSAKIIPCFMFLKEKNNADGSLERIKARLVAGGHVQDTSVYGDTSSPTADLTTVFIVFTIAANECRKVVTLDIKGAYLNAKMKEKVYMKLPRELTDIFLSMPGCERFRAFVSSDGSLNVELLKALYGCVESALLWFMELRDFFLKIGFIANPADPCLFSRATKDGKGQIMIVIYVDDLIITSVFESEIEQVVMELTEKFTELTIKRGNIHFYLGMLFTIDYDKRVCYVSMEKYVNELLSDCKIDRKSLIPASSDLLEVNDDDELLEVDESETSRDKKWFHSTVARLMYLTKRVRPDLSFCTNFLSSRVQYATVRDMRKLVKVLEYLNETRDLGLTLGAENPYRLTLYVDASYAAHVDGGSHGGILVSMGIGPIYTQSKKLKLVCKSSCEAEVVVLCDGLNVLMWIRSLLEGLQIKQLPSLVMEDNKCAIDLMSKQSAGSMRTKFLRARYGFSRQFFDDGSAILKHVFSEYQAADILSKAKIDTNLESIRTWILSGVLSINGVGDEKRSV